MTECSWKGGQAREKDQITCTVARRLGFIPRAGNEKPLKGFKQRRDMIQLTLRKGQSSCLVGNRL